MTQVLQGLIDKGTKIDLCVAIGPVPMMRAVVNVTRKANLPTVVSLNPIMVDGTGMCGACRVEVGGKTMFGCVDGPEFDGLQVDFDLLMKRLAMYKGPELIALNKFRETERGCQVHVPGRCMMTEQEKTQRNRRSPGRRCRSRTPSKGPTTSMRWPWDIPTILALLEASRCLHCKKPYCMTGCPVEVDIPDFVEMVKAGDFMGAAWKIKEKNSLPRIAGRVCPQETQCEAKCVLDKKGKGEPCAIGRLERFVAD